MNCMATSSATYPITASGRPAAAGSGRRVASLWRRSECYPQCSPRWTKQAGVRTSASSTGLSAEVRSDGSQGSGDREATMGEGSVERESGIAGADELKALLVDSERQRILKRLSEANQHNRFLKRQLQKKDDELDDIKNDLALLDLDLEALIGLAEEVANSGIPPGSRKINGKYIQSHLLSKLEAAHAKLKEQIKGVESIKYQEVTLHWVGMAEIVQLMGSFDGWIQGEDMSAEYCGSYTKFSTTMKLRPGRYEIKFLVDGEWRLSPELPTVGEGLMQNNLLVV